jgi:predicted metalloprotease with PDZ domain
LIGWRLAAGGWRLANGGWRLPDGDSRPSVAKPDSRKGTTFHFPGPRKGRCLPFGGLAALVLLCCAQAALRAEDGPPIEYVLSFPEPHQRWMQVEMTVREAGDAPLAFRMSRSSPGRYALHEFARNVWDVTATDGPGRALTLTRPNPHQWDVAGHDGTVTLRYKIHGDRLDGTYLAVDDTHAHMNVPATLMFARGHDARPARVTLTQPPGKSWRAATQLYSTTDPLVFTAPNLAYLMDSPIEFGDIVIRTFTVPPIETGGAPSLIRVALHHAGADEDLDPFVADVEKIVRQQQAVFGELPAFEPGHYTLLADYLPWARGDGMEHRNSTVLTSSQALSASKQMLLGTVAHEFFHAWNTERIRPASLEPFDLEDANASGELWLAEGFTSFVEGVTLVRAGLDSFEHLLARWAGIVNTVTGSPAARTRSAVEMSRLAPFVDGAALPDRADLGGDLYLSYYTHGAALGLGLDLSLRRATNGRTGFDDYMRALWARFGRPGAAGPPGTVATPYTLRDLRDVLADVSGDRGFADAFFDRHVEGHEALDWASLFAFAGIVVRASSPDRATLGDVEFDFSRRSGRVSAPTPAGSPAHRAGLAQGDVLESVDGREVTSADSLREALRSRSAGDEVRLTFTRRSGERVTATVTLEQNPRIELVLIERAGGALTDAQRAIRDTWTRPR